LTKDRSRASADSCRSTGESGIDEEEGRVTGEANGEVAGLGTEIEVSVGRETGEEIWNRVEEGASGTMGTAGGKKVRWRESVTRGESVVEGDEGGVGWGKGR
jgi:hypothetical protein